MANFYNQWLERFAEKRRRFFGQKGGEESEEPPNSAPQQPSDIVYENNSLKLIVEKSSFKRQKVFRLQDHLFKFKIVQKKPQDQLPLLSELFDFLHAALLHVLESVKTFYRKEDHNIAYLTLHQEPMVNGLNTGALWFSCCCVVTLFFNFDFRRSFYQTIQLQLNHIYS